MPICQIRVEFVSRSNGGNACRKSAYYSRDSIEFEGNCVLASRTFDFSDRESPAYHDILLPEGADENFKIPEVLWNAASQKEKQHNAREAIDVMLALPDDKAISLEDRITLAQTFVQKHFVNKGLAAQINIHAPDKVLRDGKEVPGDHNWHAHVLVTTRKFTPDGKSLSDLKARQETEALVKTHWPSTWANHQNAFFRSKGLDLHVDPPGIIPQEHLGPVRMRGQATELMKHHEKLLAENAQAAQNPYNILDHLTKNQSTFNREDFERFVNKHVPSDKIATVQKAFWDLGDIIQLRNLKTEKHTGLFTTKTVIEEENQILRVADRIYLKKSPKTSNPHIQHTQSLTLKGEQYIAYNNILENGKGITCIQGYAGTGKSYLLKALANAYEEHYEKSFFHSQGALVRAFGPDNATAKVLQEKGFSHAENIYRFLFSAQKGDRNIETGREVWILDEAGKMGNKPLLEMLKLANRKGAKVILAGDQAQFSSVERGGMFKVLCERYGSHSLEDIYRQERVEQRALAQKLAKGEIAEALDHLHRLKGIHFSSDRVKAMESLVTKWAQDHFPSENKTNLKSPESSLIVAQTNKEVHLLNEIIHRVRQQRGEISKENHTFYTPFGKLNISQGDAIEFRKNNRELGINNGTTGKLLQIEPNRLTVSVEESDKRTRLVTIDPKDYCNFQLGYATTCYRSQGKTVGRSYVLHSPYLNKQMAYVALTRHTKDVHYFVAQTEAKNLAEIKNQALKDRSKTSTLYYTYDEVIEKRELAKEREKSIEQLKIAYNKRSTRLKGHLLSKWDDIKVRAQKAQAYFQDRKPSKAFFNPDFKTKEQAFSQENLKLQSFSVLDRVDCVKIAERVARNDQKAREVENQIQNELAKQSAFKHPSQSFNRHECDLFLDKGMKVFGESDKAKAFEAYMEQAKESSELYAVMVAEKLGGSQRNTGLLQKYQNACIQRNQAAHELKAFLSDREITEKFGSKTSQAINSQAEKHQEFLAKEELKAEEKGSLEKGLVKEIPALLSQLFPEGPTKRTAREFRFEANSSLAVVHSGEKAGQFYDFEKKEGGGPLQLIERELKLETKQAEEWAHNFLESAADLSISPSYSRPQAPKVEGEDREWISQKPSKEQEAPTYLEQIGTIARFYREESLHPYKNEKGELLHYVWQLKDLHDGEKKTSPPLSYGYFKDAPDKPHWALREFKLENDKTPLYNLQELQEKPTHPVLIVQGEKTADEALKTLNRFDAYKYKDTHHIPITWSGGQQGISKVDWSPLVGREVFVWPNNDPEGFKVARDVCAELRKVGVNKLEMASPKRLEEHFPYKWNLAEPIPEKLTGYQFRDVLNHGLEKTRGIENAAYDLDLNKKNKLDRFETKEFLWRVEERIFKENHSFTYSGCWQEKFTKEAANIYKNAKDQVKELYGPHDPNLASIAKQTAFQAIRTGNVPQEGDIGIIRGVIRDFAAVEDKKYLDLEKREDPKIYEWARETQIEKACERALFGDPMDKEELKKLADQTKDLSMEFSKEMAKENEHHKAMEHQKEVEREMSRGYDLGR